METSVVKFSLDANIGGVAAIRSVIAKGSKSPVFFWELTHVF